MTGSTPRVSVIIPAFNRATTLRASVESVLRQSYTDLELIVVDDCSSDDTANIALAFDDPRIRLLRTTSNLGAGGARNVGVANSRGSWIAFQDSDDEWLPTKLEKQMALLDKGGAGQVAAYCGLLRLGELNDVADARLEMSYVPGKSQLKVDGELIEELLRTSMISTQTLVVRKNIFESIGGFDAELTPIEDWDFALSLCQKGLIKFVDQPLVLQRFSENSISRDGDKRLISQIRVVEKHYSTFSKYPGILAYQYRLISGALRRKGDFAEALRYLLRAIKVHPSSIQLWARAAHVGILTLAANPFLAWPRRNFGRAADK